MTSGQESLMARLRGAAATLTARWDEVRGVYTFIRAIPSFDDEAAAATFLRDFGGLFGPANVAERLRLLHTRTDRLGWRHMEYQQEHVIGVGEREMRLPVYGSKLVVHVAPAGTLPEVWSNCWRDVSVREQPRLTAAQARERLATGGDAGGRERGRTRDLDDEMGEPSLVIYPWREGFRLAWTVYATAVVPGEAAGAYAGVAAGDFFIDAVSGETFLFFPTRMHVAGSGLGVTPVGGPYVVRALEVRATGVAQAHELVDASRARQIITYHDHCVSRPGNWVQRSDGLMNDVANGVTTPSVNAGGPNWVNVAASTSTAAREASQQPEVDGHFFGGQVYDWYAAVGSRVGWDDNAFAAAGNVELNMPIRVVVHTRDPNSNPSTCHTAYSQFWRKKVNNRWRGLVLFCDGNLNPASPQTPRAMDFPAGDPAIFAHEYQHVVTYFSFRNHLNEPGIGYLGWSAALHEGLSDAFGCMFAGSWRLGQDISHDVPAAAIRSIVYPRDGSSWENRPGGFGHANKDHVADQTPPPPTTENNGWHYDHGTILAHCAFLMTAGGVHHRDGQPPRAPLIPVRALGVDVVAGVPVSRAARIWYEGLASFSATNGQVTASPIDATAFRRFRDGCESAAIAAYGAGSREHRTTLLAFHAVGLDEPGEPYGADLTFLPWGAEWWRSRPYLGGIRATCPDWKSIDLFVNNGGASGWNAIVDALGPGGVALGFENNVYVRVRNVGDQTATNVNVDFFYAKAGTGDTGWHPVTDAANTVQRLALADLGAGQLSFDESDQDTPPATACVKWHIPPLVAGETVDHFCLKAVVSSANDVNSYNNEVQSNVSYAVLAASGVQRFEIPFVIGNPRKLAIDVDIRITAPAGWSSELAGVPKELKPGAEKTVTLLVEAPEDAGAFAMPLDGEVRGRVTGSVAGRVVGALSDAHIRGGRVTGNVSLDVGAGVLLGAFDGRLDAERGAVEGRVDGVFRKGSEIRRVAVMLQGGLRPWRRVDIVQTVDGEPLGGITLEFRRPPPEAGDWPADPPVATRADQL
jgi:Zn-dependent metalloprotease